MSQSVAEVIAPELPFLRRFARALTGSQEGGDSYVVAMLEALVADKSCLRRDLSPRSAVYHAFLKIWNSIAVNNESDASLDGIDMEVAQRRLGNLTPLPRQAFLLATVEEFSTADIAEIMGCSPTVVGNLLDEAGRSISDQIAARVLIIEDEPLIALDIETLVTEIGHEVVHVASTRLDAKSAAEKYKPGLILADVQLADGSSGIDAVSDIKKMMDVPVIFITAYPELLLTGQRVEPTFLISKPFKPEMVKAIISQALFFNDRDGTRASQTHGQESNPQTEKNRP